MEAKDRNINLAECITVACMKRNGSEALNLYKTTKLKLKYKT